MGGVATTVAVPVFNAAQELRVCLQSLDQTLEPGTAVLLVDDASTDTEIGSLLDEYANHSPLAVCVLRNETNLGFVATANRIFAESSGDIVLLNSDTITTPGWLQRMVAAAASRERVATVTPFSNNAEICSFPIFCTANPVPESPNALARVIATVGESQYPELPTAVGFCMWMSRVALDALGGFDAARFGRGYGEENDFCRRAVKAGYVNLLCDDAYVVHVGGASFSPLGLKPGGEAMERLVELHPEYPALVAEFIERDPIAARRDELIAGVAAADVTESRPMTSKDTPLDFDGERFTPECVREMWYEHWHRYAFAQDFVADKQVLDLACGEGYGSDLLARRAHSVTGIDVSAEAVAHAERRYGDRANLSFQTGDCAAIPAQDNQFDVVVSFETLEHVEAQEPMLDEFARVLRDDGLLIISTPDKRTYSDETGYENEFHVRELYRDEFESLVKARFAHVRLYGQKLMFHSAIWPVDGGGGVRAAQVSDGQVSVQATPATDPIYYVALCSQQPLEASAGLWLFGDQEESVYQHYNDEVRRNMAARDHIAHLEAALKVKNAPQPEPSTPWYKRWKARRHD